VTSKQSIWRFNATDAISCIHSADPVRRTMRTIALTTVAFIAAVAIYVAMFACFESIDEDYTYEEFIMDVQNADAIRMVMAISSGSFRFRDNPEIKPLLHAMWKGERYRGMGFGSAIQDPLVRIELANALLFLEEQPREEYVDLLFGELASTDHDRRSAAVSSMNTIFDNRAVRALRTVVIESPELADKAISELTIETTGQVQKVASWCLETRCFQLSSSICTLSTMSEID